MTHVHRLDCQAGPADCRFFIESADKAEVVELARKHMEHAHSITLSRQELLEEYFEIV